MRVRKHLDTQHQRVLQTFEKPPRGLLVLITLDESGTPSRRSAAADSEAVAFVRRRRPHLYQQDAEQAAARLGARIIWTMIHRGALLLPGCSY
ncbi:hypothetical protein [Streptomyces sp. NPDC048269]|uniref:hypothetical protein n=1 Tax=Streptomyces sp. NPDC048269 TaxID=3155753 RepID=UPI0034381415